MRRGLFFLTGSLGFPELQQVMFFREGLRILLTIFSE